MKTIYLQVLGEGWESFQYTNISELEEEFAKRRIMIGNYCELGDRCELGDCCELGYRCKLGDDCKVPKALLISASRHSVSYWGDDAIQIGCRRYTILDWQKHFRKIGKAENYSEEQIAEYKNYIDLIATMHNTWNIGLK